MSSYSERLKDPRWQRRRLDILQRANWSCESCGADKKTLHVHHKVYRKGAMPWEYPDDQLQSLCEDCHELEHQLRARLSATLAELNLEDIEELLGYAMGIVHREYILGARLADPLLPDRQLSLSTWAEACGFDKCVGHISRSADVDRLLEVVPRESSAVVLALSLRAMDDYKRIVR